MIRLVRVQAITGMEWRCSSILCRILPLSLGGHTIDALTTRVKISNKNLDIIPGNQPNKDGLLPMTALHCHWGISVVCM